MYFKKLQKSHFKLLYQTPPQFFANCISLPMKCFFSRDTKYESTIVTFALYLKKTSHS